MFMPRDITVVCTNPAKNHRHNPHYVHVLSMYRTKFYVDMAVNISLLNERLI